MTHRCVHLASEFPGRSGRPNAHSQSHSKLFCEKEVSGKFLQENPRLRDTVMMILLMIYRDDDDTNNDIP